jgi:hypothetical protein
MMMSAKALPAWKIVNKSKGKRRYLPRQRLHFFITIHPRPQSLFNQENDPVNIFAIGVPDSQILRGAQRINIQAHYLSVLDCPAADGKSSAQC